MIKQISVFLPNTPGVLAKFTKTLMEKNINMRAMTVAETADYGILRMVVDQTNKAVDILKKENYLVSLTDVLAVDIPDRPGALHEIAEILGENDINIEYIYSSTVLKEEAIIVLRVDNNDKAIEILESKGIKLVDEM
ncbi:MAG: ACT domain-containing protein [Candidatus Lokiarchaeota archaeon]|nr:ACT domain-containing protein [Candidatus Lokiarchaeota archaeon]MBD3342787.1 ACT domain-containing protein [Candidatus Lokiarchaeota archaeon]